MRGGFWVVRVVDEELGEGEIFEGGAVDCIACIACEVYENASHTDPTTRYVNSDARHTW